LVPQAVIDDIFREAPNFKLGFGPQKADYKAGRPHKAYRSMFWQQRSMFNFYSKVYPHIVGFYGQYVFIFPELDMVVAKHSRDPTNSDDFNFWAFELLSTQLVKHMYDIE